MDEIFASGGQNFTVYTSKLFYFFKCVLIFLKCETTGVAGSLYKIPVKAIYIF